VPGVYTYIFSLRESPQGATFGPPIAIIVKVLQKPPQPTPVKPIIKKDLEEEKKDEVIKPKYIVKAQETTEGNVNQFEGEITCESKIIEAEPDQ